jgi:hypothetical protein
MAFPTSLDSLTDPAATDKRNNPSLAEGQTLQNNAIEAVEAKVGIDSSAVTTSHDYKLSGVTGTDKAVSKTGTETLTNKTLTSPAITSPTITTSIIVTSLDLNSSELILDADGDTTITADSDDQIDFKIGGTDRFQMTASTFYALNGRQIATDTVAEYNNGVGVTVDGLNIIDGVLNTDDSVVTTNITDENVTSRKLAPTVIFESCTGNTVLGTVEANITGCTSTFTPAIASYAIITVCVDIGGASNAADIFVLEVDVDGVDQVPSVVWSVPTGGGRFTLYQQMVVALTVASHTLKLHGIRASGVGTCSAYANSTSMLIQLIGDANVTNS